MYIIMCIYAGRDFKRLVPKNRFLGREEAKSPIFNGSQLIGSDTSQKKLCSKTKKSTYARKVNEI